MRGRSHKEVRVFSSTEMAGRTWEERKLLSFSLWVVGVGGHAWWEANLVVSTHRAWDVALERMDRGLMGLVHVTPI